MSKFKVGDKVVRVGDKRGIYTINNKYLQPEQIVTIKKIDRNVVFFEEVHFVLYLDDLEFSEIYFSPLYKAMKED